MDVTIHRGTDEIGGSCVEVATETTRLIIDTGLPLVKPDREPFDSGFLRGKTTEQLIADGVIPKVEGLYTAGDRPDAILLSHSHMDHTGLLHLTAPEIPIYATSGTSKMMSAGAIFGGQKQLDRSRHVEVVSTAPQTIGDITVTPYAVDHSAYGSVAFLLEAGGKTVLYSGDLRWHGRKPGMINDLVTAMQKRTVDALIMEGTHIGTNRPKGITEYELEPKIVETMQEAKGLVLASFSPIDLDRVVTYYKSAKAAGRVFVPDVYTAYVMYLVHRQAGVPHPAKADNIRVYVNAWVARRNIPRITDLFQGATITLDEILKAPQKHAMMFRPSMIDLDFGGKLPEGCRCVYSYWQGYLEKPDWQKCQKHLEDARGDLVPRHASGHIYEEDLVRFVKSVAPKTVIPIHTFEPDGFHGHFANVTRLTNGERFRLV